MFVLRKYDILAMPFYFKCKDITGQTWTSTIKDAMMFEKRDDAVDFNHKWLYGECTVIPF